MRVSVVIIAESAQGTIRYTLDSLRKQSRKPDEIIVVVPSIDDNTLEPLKEYPEVRVVIDSGSTRGSARAAGIQHAIGDIIAFTDAECKADPEWLKAFETLYLEREDISVQGGPIVRIRDLRQAPQCGILSPSCYIKKVRFIPTANLSFRREVVSIAGNFDERLHEGEDLDFCARLLKHGIAIILNSGALIYHLDRTIFSLMKRYANYGKSRAKVFFIHRRYVFSAALVAIVHILLIFTSIFALIIHRYDISLAAVGLSLAHQFYNFTRGSNAHKKVLALKTFAISVVPSYVLYASFIIHLLYYLLMRSKGAVK